MLCIFQRQLLAAIFWNGKSQYLSQGIYRSFSADFCKELQMNLQEQQSIELACSKLCNQFAVFNDAGRHEELVALFTDDGLYARPLDPENFVQGPAAILAAFKARPQD